MRNCHIWIMGGVAAIVMGAAAAPVCGQGEFQLKYVDAPDNAYPVLPFGLYWGGEDERPGEVKADPKGLTGPRRYFPLPWGDRHVMVILDLTKPVKLYVDAAGTGDFSAVPPLTATGLTFGPVTLPGPDGKPGATVRFHPLEYGPASGTFKNTAIRCAGYAAGEVTLAGQTYRVAVVQGWTGRYDEVYAVSAPPEGAPRRHATFAIDLDRDGKFDLARGEVHPLTPIVQVGDAYYAVRVAPNGSSVRLEKAKPQMGEVETGSSEVQLTLDSDTGRHRLEGAGRRTMPAGRYETVEILCSRRDASGSRWQVTTRQGGLGSGQGFHFQVEPGKVTGVAAGPPLALKVEAQAGPAGEVEITASILGQGGERYFPRFEKEGAPLSLPPKFRIVDEAGKVLAGGSTGFT